MRRLLLLILIAASLATIPPVEAASRVIKVLPHFLDLKGRHSLSPSLYERDAYQMFLRTNPKERSGIRFDVQWKSDVAKNSPLKLRLEIRGSKGTTIETKTLEQEVEKTGCFTTWTPLLLTGDRYKQFGDLVAWRATLWNGETQIAEQKSFLWN